MIRSKVPLRLLAPAATDGGTATADPMLESDPSGLSGWMSELPPLDTDKATQQPQSQTQPPPKAESDNGSTAQNPGGSGGTRMSSAAKSADTDGSRSQAAASAASTQPADATGKSADGNDAKSGDAKAKEASVASEKEKGGDEAAKTIEELEKEKFPRHSNQWEDYKKKYGERFRKAEEKFKADLAVATSKLGEYEKQLAEAQKKVAEPGELPADVKSRMDALTKENEEMSKRIQILDVTQHPKFQAYFTRQVDTQKALAKSILGEKSAEFDKLVELPAGDYKTEKLEEFISNLPTLQQTRIANVINRLDEISEEKRQEIEKAGQHKETIAAQSKTQKEATAKARDKAISDYAAEVQKSNPIFKPREGDSEWNEGVAERVATARKFLTGEGVKPADLIKAAFDAAALPATLRAWQADIAAHEAEMKDLKEQLKTAQAQVSKFTAAQPRLEAGGPNATGGTDAPGTRQARPSVGQTPQEASNSFFDSLMEASR